MHFQVSTLPCSTFYQREEYQFHSLHLHDSLSISPWSRGGERRNGKELNHCKSQKLKRETEREVIALNSKRSEKTSEIQFSFHTFNLNCITNTVQREWRSKILLYFHFELLLDVCHKFFFPSF